MKANKVLKRLAKIESLISDVTERYPATAPDITEALRDVTAAVARAKQAVSVDASSVTRETLPVKNHKPTRKVAPKGKPAKKNTTTKETPLVSRRSGRKLLGVDVSATKSE